MPLMIQARAATTGHPEPAKPRQNSENATLDTSRPGQDSLYPERHSYGGNDGNRTRVFSLEG